MSIPRALTVDASGLAPDGSCPPIGVHVLSAETKCALGGETIPAGTVVLRVDNDDRSPRVYCPSCMHQVNATLMCEWNDLHPEGELSDLEPCPRCGHDHVKVHVGTAHATTYHLIGAGDYEQVDGENFLEADNTVLVECANCGSEYWAREAFWPLLG